MEMPAIHRLRLATGLSCQFLEWAPSDPACEHTVVLVHGFLDLAWGFRPLVEAGLAGRYHIVAPDLRGHGDSDPVGPGGYYHFLDYLADLASLFDEIGRSRVSVVGHSMGGNIAGYFAGSFPKRLHKLVIMEGLGPPEPPLDPGPRIAHWIADWQGVRGKTPKQYADLAAATARLRISDPLLDEAMARALAEVATRVDERGGRRFKHDPLHVTSGPHSFRLDFAEALWRRVACPLLFVEGALSMMRLADEETARRLSCFHDARRVVLDGAGHMMQRHQPAALARVLIDFLG